jgi:hypothetical protein
VRIFNALIGTVATGIELDDAVKYLPAHSLRHRQIKSAVLYTALH